MPSSELAIVLREANVLKHGLFTLRSGERSPVYVDLRQIPSVPSSFGAVTEALVEVVRSLKVEVVAGAETAGIPLAAVVAVKTRLPMIYVRKEPKGYGTGSQVEGVLRPGAQVVLIDDLITQGTSKFVFLDALERAGASVNDVLVILDREQGGKRALAERGVRLHALLTLRDLLSAYRKIGALTDEQYTEITAYLDNPRAWEASLRV